MIKAYIKLLRLDKPIGILLLLWPTFWALWLAAKGTPELFILVIFILGTIVMRSAGCVINDIADRNFDKFVARTKLRPSTTGEISVSGAFSIFALLCFLALLLVLQLNFYSILLSILALSLACIYPFTKRLIQMPQLCLSLAFSVSIPMAFTAQLDHLPLLAVYLFLLNAIWVMIYDTLYAMVDRGDDLKIGVKSTAIFFGSQDKRIIAVLQILMLLGLIFLGVWQALHWPYYLGLIIVGSLFMYQQYLIRNREPALCFKAFLNNNYVGLAIFLGIFFQ